MKNEEWNELKEKYEKERDRRWDIEAKQEAAKSLKEKIEKLIEEKDRIGEIDIRVPRVEWQNHEHCIVLKDNWRLLDMFLECLETFIPKLDEILKIDIENEEGE